jgi:hypothetical protein
MINCEKSKTNYEKYYLLLIKYLFMARTTTVRYKINKIEHQMFQGFIKSHIIFLFL